MQVVSEDVHTQDGDATVMKMMFLGMFAMMDVTAFVLAADTQVTWEKFLYHSLIGSTLSVVWFGMWHKATQLELARWAVSAIILGCVSGALASQIVSHFLLVEVNSILVVPVAFGVGLFGPYAIQKYAEEAIDDAAKKAGLDGKRSDQSIIETTGSGDHETIGGDK